MRWRAPLICSAAAALVACGIISGASDLTIGEPPADELPVTEGGPLEDVFVVPRDALTPLPEAAVDAGAEAGRLLCDEPGLVARWTFDESSGSEVLDCTHFRNDGLNDGGFRTVGERDGGMAFDGGWVGFGNPTSLQLKGPMSVCAWVRPASFVAGERGYIVSKLSDPYGGGWRLATVPGAGASVNISLNVPNGDGGIGETKGGNVILNAWQHVCGVFESSGQRVFLGSQRVANDLTPFPSITLTNDEVRIGIQGDGTSPFLGVIDDVRIYSRALTDAEVAALAQP